MCGWCLCVYMNSRCQTGARSGSSSSYVAGGGGGGGGGGGDILHVPVQVALILTS